MISGLESVRANQLRDGASAQLFADAAAIRRSPSARAAAPCRSSARGCVLHLQPAATQQGRASRSVDAAGETHRHALFTGQARSAVRSASACCLGGRKSWSNRTTSTHETEPELGAAPSWDQARRRLTAVFLWPAPDAPPAGALPSRWRRLKRACSPSLGGGPDGKAALQISRRLLAQPRGWPLACSC